MKLGIVRAAVGFLPLVLSLTPAAFAQSSAQTASALPRLVRFGGTVKDLNGNPLTGVVGITFALYSEQTGGAPLWLETQNVTADSNGHYTVLLGSTKPDGLPAELFTSEQAHWVGVQISGQAEQSRVLLVSAPYALKAGDAETIGGLPPSAFVLAAPPAIGSATASSSAASAAAESVSPATTSDVTTTGGTVNTIPLFSTATNIQNSILTQTTATAVNVGGILNLPATAAATKTAGADSRPLDLVASSFSSTTSTAVNQVFRWQAEPAANDTVNPSGTLNLLYGPGATAPSETGVKLSSKGIFTFATGQTFPGTGTITGINTAAGSGLDGGGTTGTLSLSVPSAGITNAMLAHPSLTLTPGGGMSGGGAVALGGTTTLGLKTCAADQVLEFISGAWVCTNAATGTVTSVGTGLGLTGGPITTSGTLAINTTVVPQLKANNIFTGTQSINGSLGINTTAPTQSLDVTSGNAIVRGPANFKTTGNTAYLYVGDTSHPIEAIWNTGLAIGAWKVPRALFIQDATGSVGIGTTAPEATLNVVSNTGLAGDFSSLNVGSTGLAAYGAIGSASVAGGVGLVGVGGANNAAGATGGVGGSFTGGDNNNESTGTGGVGITSTGGTGTTAGGIGFTATGGGGITSGAAGLVATGGSPFGGFDAGNGGDGIDAFAGGWGGSEGVGGIGVSAVGGYGANGGGDGVNAVAGSGCPFCENYAGYFSGDVEITGTLNGSAPAVKVDDPLDPADKYLVHASVESSEMKNIYDGNVTTDGEGRATVQLPEWFEVLNTDFRYQLTVIGQFAQAIVGRKIENNRFEIRTSAPKVEVSWQVTGVRQDAYAKAHPLVVEQEKDARLHGFYIHPELYGAPPEKQIEWARHPQTMKKIQEMRAKQLATIRAGVSDLNRRK